MAIKIRCNSCSRKISVDDAFAGGVCRCPYCTETVPVPARRGRRRPPTEAPQARPDSPPGGPEVTPEAPRRVAPARPRPVPVASPVRTQWIVILILLLAAIGAGVVAAVWVMRAAGPPGRQPDEGPVHLREVNPFLEAPPSATRRPAIAGIEIRSPVVYCIDNGTGMYRIFDLVSAVTQASIESLGPEGRFTILLCARRDADGNERAWAMPGGYHAGGPRGRAEADRFLESVEWFHEADLPWAIAKALELKARTIVFCGRTAAAEPRRLGRTAREKGAAIVTIAITRDDEVASSLAALAEASGGKTRRLTRDELDIWLQSGN